MIAHYLAAHLADARFRVWPGGRDRARRIGQKTVHAFVVGTPVDEPTPAAGGRAVLYDHAAYDGFVYADDLSPATAARRVLLATAVDPATGRVRPLVLAY